MAILFESSTHIEFLLKEALTNAKIAFLEQYRVYEGGSFSEVKYVADFLLTNGAVKLIVECDGVNYHIGKEKMRRQKERDLWLKLKGYTVLHFSTQELKSNMDCVIETIKYHLNYPCDTSKGISHENKLNIVSNNYATKSDKSYDVILFCYYNQIPDGICVVYKYKSMSYETYSDERKKICKNVPEDMLETTAVYLALLDLKKSVCLKIYYGGTVYKDHFDFAKTFRRKITVLSDGRKILQTHKMSTSHVNFSGDYRFDTSENQKIMNELRSRCLQISNNENKRACINHFEYSKLSCYEISGDS